MRIINHGLRAGKFQTYKAWLLEVQRRLRWSWHRHATSNAKVILTYEIPNDLDLLGSYYKLSDVIWLITANHSLWTTPFHKKSLQYTFLHELGHRAPS